MDGGVAREFQVGSARRRRERPLRAWWRHEQLSLRMQLVSVEHHSWQSKTSVGVQTARGEESDEENYAKGLKTPPPAGTQYFAMTPDDDASVPELCVAGLRPEALGDFPEPLGKLGKPGNIIEAPSLDVPALVVMDELVPQVRISERIPEQFVVPGLAGIPQERISQRIPDQFVDPGLVGIPQEQTSDRIPEPIVYPGLVGIPQERHPEPIPEQIVVSEVVGTPQEQTSERIPEQIVVSEVTGIPQERTSERTSEQIGVPPGTVSQRIVEQVVDGTLPHAEPIARVRQTDDPPTRAAAAWLDAPQGQNHGDCRTFSPGRKVRGSLRSRLWSWCRTRARPHRARACHGALSATPAGGRQGVLLERVHPQVAVAAASGDPSCTV